MREQTRRLKNSFRPYALYYLTKIMAKIPLFIYLGISQESTTKASMTLSNVAGPKTPIVYDGVACRKMAVLPPGVGKVSFGFNIISIGETAKISILSDETACANPEEVIQLFENTLNEILAASGQSV